MIIRRAEEKDVPRIDALLMQVLNIHAQGRPDLFIPDTKKYTDDELKEMIHDDSKPIFVAVDEYDTVMGYAFTVFQQRAHATNMQDIRTLFIDDLCVDGKYRGNKVGETLFKYVCDFAKKQGCYHVTLNVWSFNEKAIGFYEAEGLKPMETVMEYILPEDQKEQ